jgi:non-ribosomal peptide synthase protein (TIGR01720 family)
MVQQKPLVFKCWFKSDGMNSTTKQLGNHLENEKCYILNSDLKPVPIGAIGELHIGGTGLARGYLNKPDLTKEKFIQNPFQTDEEKKKGKNSRIYKTGDLVRWLPDGNLDYIGRNDFQVKIRGFRIELEEIESVLLEYEGIKQSVVLAKERKKDNDEIIKYLVGYYVSDIKLDELKIMQHLKTKLVEYMVPSILIYLDKLPITINGKLDTKALPDRIINIDNNYIEPRNELEIKIQQIFSTVLGIEQNKISIKDDFFMLGGDSIVSIQLVSKIREILGYTISIKDIFKYKTIELLYDNIIINQQNKKDIKTEQGLLKGEFDLLPIQKWFLNSENFENKNYFNQSFMIKVPQLDLDKLKLSMKKLIEHHDSLRLKFKKDLNNKYYQYYDDNINISLKVIDIKSLDNLNDLLTELQSNFNIENGPLYNYAYIYGYDDNSCRLWFAFHHLIIDTVSWRIILDDLKKIYNDEKLSNKGTSYRQWIETIYNFNSNEKQYWLDILNDFETNNFSNNLQLFNKNINNYETFSLNEEQTDILLRKCNKTFNTNINDILLTALSYTLSELTNNDKNYILLEGHGREDIDDTIDISKTVGWFTSMFPVCLYKKDDLSECIIENKENLRLIPNKGVLFGKNNDYNKNLPKISFNYLGQFDNFQNYNDFWVFTNEASGNNALDNIDSYININFIEIDKIIKFKIITNLIDSNLIFLNFKSNLIKIIIHCDSLKIRSYLTSSDVNYIVNRQTLHFIQSNNKIDDILYYVELLFCSGKSSFYFEEFIIWNNNNNFDNKRQLFLFPPGDGGAESYLNTIVKYFSNTKLILFNNLIFHLKNFKFLDILNKLSFQDVAFFYIKLIKKIQPHGPYNFFGWSFGGILSIEIARILKENFNESISNIFLIDPLFRISNMKFSNDYYINIDFKPVIINLDSNLILFKAMKFKDEKDKELINSLNNLDFIIEKKNIKIFQMLNNDHDSWLFDHNELVKISKVILDSI